MSDERDQPDAAVEAIVLQFRERYGLYQNEYIIRRAVQAGRELGRRELPDFDPADPRKAAWAQRAFDRGQLVGARLALLRGKLETRIAQLEQALRKHGRHASGPDGCQAERAGSCTCGLDAALAGMKEGECIEGLGSEVDQLRSDARWLRNRINQLEQGLRDARVNIDDALARIPAIRTHGKKEV